MKIYHRTHYSLVSERFHAPRRYRRFETNFSYEQIARRRPQFVSGTAQRRRQPDFRLQSLRARVEEHFRKRLPPSRLYLANSRHDQLAKALFSQIVILTFFILKRPTTTYNLMLQLNTHSSQI